MDPWIIDEISKQPERERPQLPAPPPPEPKPRPIEQPDRGVVVIQL